VRAQAFEWLAAQDRVLCQQCNRASNIAWVRQTFAAASRLGNGVFWYTLMIALLVSEGYAALPAVLHMIVVGLICTVIYKTVKAHTSRPRPYQAQPEITLCVSPLDQFSFPSGHTLHASAFAIVAIAYYPALFWLLVPFAVRVACSRVVLGLHYPSDVLAGAAIGASLAGLSFGI
jgi:undecaprenyl-diphosphatase